MAPMSADPAETLQEGAGDTLGGLWRDAVARHAARPLLVSHDDDSSFSYAEAGEIVSRLAARLLACGVRKGDRVAVVSPFHPEAAFVFWAAAGTGAIVVPLDYRLSPQGLAELCDEVEPAIIFGDRDRADAVTRPGVPVVTFDDESGTPPAGEPFADWLEGAPADAGTVAPPEPDDPAVILFTSGTSSRAKGVVLSHGALCRSGRLMADSYGWQPDDLLLNLGELHTMSGLRNPCVAALHAGSSFLVASPSHRANALLVGRVVERRRATLLGCVPALLGQFNAFVHRIGREPLESLRLLLCTGSSLPDVTRETFQANYGVPVMNYYGLTETAGLCAGAVPETAGSLPGSIGVPLGCRVRIADATGADVCAGGVGELLIRSDNLMIGYWHDRPLTERVLRDGWFHTGDLARQEPGGELVLLGRLGDSFKDQRGEFIHPGEIEQVLESHPLVNEAGVFCRTLDDGTGEIVAFVAEKRPVTDWRELEADLRRLVAERLGVGRVPARIERIIALPRGTNEKLLRRVLKEICPRHEQ